MEVRKRIVGLRVQYQLKRSSTSLPTGLTSSMGRKDSFSTPGGEERRECANGEIGKSLRESFRGLITLGGKERAEGRATTSKHCPKKKP